MGGTEHASGDFGQSPGSGLSVSSLIHTPLRNTAVLLAVTLVLMFPFAIAIGTASALSRDTWLDGGLQTAVLVFASLPSFVVGIALILLFAFTWKVFPHPKQVKAIIVGFLRNPRSRSFACFVPKPDLGNEGKLRETAFSR